MRWTRLPWDLSFLKLKQLKVSSRSCYALKVQFVFRCFQHTSHEQWLATVVKVSELTRQLEEQLGPGTMELGMRVSLHCGSVSAWMFRGQKSCFQLFGGKWTTCIMFFPTTEFVKWQRFTLNVNFKIWKQTPWIWPLESKCLAQRIISLSSDTADLLH